MPAAGVALDVLMGVCGDMGDFAELKRPLRDSDIAASGDCMLLVEALSAPPERKVVSGFPDLVRLLFQER